MAVPQSPSRPVPLGADTDAPDPAVQPTIHSSPLARHALPATHPGLTGKVLGDFEVLQEVGRGGMGVVYKARQRSLDRPVALKFLSASARHDQIHSARFLQEARAVAALRHPNIITIHQVGNCPLGDFLVMEYVDGPSLESLARRRSLPVAWVTSLLAVLAEAVHAAHIRGVLHRDLKPANVLVENLRRPVLIDFGLARFLDACSFLTLEGTIMGSPSYMAPEQAGKDRIPVGPAADIYSLGAILYFLLTRRAPYDEGSFLSTVLKVVAPEMPPAVRELVPRVPAELERICMKCLSKKPAARYPNARALATDLRRCHIRLKHAR